MSPKNPMFSSAWIRLKDHKNRAVSVRISEILLKDNCIIMDEGTISVIASINTFLLFKISISSSYKYDSRLFLVYQLDS